MGKDLRTVRPQYSYERFLVYPANTDVNEILEHSASAKGAFRGVGVGNATYNKNDISGLTRSYMKIDTILTSDNIDIKADDLIYNTYAKELYIVESWEEDEEPSNLEFSTRPITRRTLHVRAGLKK